MAVLKIALTIILVLVCIGTTVVIMMQEGKTSGLAGLSGAGADYWSKNKGRTREGKLEKLTKWLVLAFFVLALVLNIL